MNFFGKKEKTFKVLVTGGSGMVGKALKRIHPDWIYVSSRDADLTLLEDTQKLFEKHKPNAVVHLAAMVGGLYMNLEKNDQMFIDNMRMEMNVFECCQMHNVKYGVFCLSTCIFPDNIEYPLYEDMLHNGPPHSSNYGYAYAKRMIEVLCREKYACIIPTNIYGPHDNFSTKNGHVIPALIHKAYQAYVRGDIFKVKGSGKALRQFIHCDDVAKCISNLLYSQESVIIAPDEEVSIEKVVTMIAKEFQLKFIEYDSSFSDGQLRKTASNQKLKQIFPDIKFKSFEEGLIETIQWFKKNYPNLRY